jgi:protein-disulfide isomerase
MNRVKAIVFAALALHIAGAAAQTNPGAPDPALVDAIVKKLESSGALDRATDQAVERYVQRQQEAQRTAQEQRLAQLRQAAKNARAVDARDHVRGNRKAEVSLIEYSDYECPFCKRFHPTMQQVLARYGDRVNWVWRHYPLPMHEPAAQREALAAECAAKLGGDKAFWSYSDALFQNTRSDGKGLPDSMSLQSLAAKSGLDQAKFAACLKSPEVRKPIEDDFADAEQIGVQATPTTIARNNKTGAVDVIVGAQPLDAVAAQIDRLLGQR